MTYRYLPSMGLRVLQVVVLLESLLRGVTYLTASRAGAIVTTDIEASAPMQVWGIAFVSFAVVGLFGEALMSGTNLNPLQDNNPRAWPSFIAHSGLMILYLTMAVAYLDASLTVSPVLVQAGGAMIVFTYLHWLFARRRKHHAG